MSGILQAIGFSSFGNSANSWGPQDIKMVTFREATENEVEDFNRNQLNQSKVTWLLRGVWTILERTINTIHFIATKNIKANYERSLNKDLFLAPHRNWFLPDAWIISHPSILSEVMNQHRHNPDGIFQMRNQKLIDSLIKEMFNDAEIKSEDLIFLSSTPDVTHKYHKFFAHFFTNKNLAQYLPTINQIVAETIQSWADQKEINLTLQTKLFSCKIMATLFLGVSEQYSDIVDAIDTYSGYLSAKFQHKSIDEEKLSKARQLFKNISDIAIADAKNEKSPQSLVKAMLSDGGFSTKEIYLTIFHLFFAGVDNSATTMTHAIMKCAQSQNLQQRIQTECTEICNQKNRHHLYELTDHFTLIHKIITESLRVFPPAYKVTRISAKPLILEVSNKNGNEVQRFIPENTRLELMMSAAAKYSHLCHHSMDQFNPDRYENKELPSSFASLPWLPFGKGAHSCPGRALFQAESKLLLTSLVLGYHLSTNIVQEPNQIGTAFNRLDRDVYLSLEPNR